jgi:hypothetical protein
MGERLSYAIVTPARNEAANITRLGACLTGQRQLPKLWVIVDNASTDDTAAIASALASNHHWIRVVNADPTPGKTRAEPIVQAFHAGLAELEQPIDLVVKLDADISMDADFFVRLVNEFEQDRSLGIASGSCYEQQADRTWRQRHGTGSGVWGGCRVYRWTCLQDVLPLEKRMGWDTLDLLKAQVRGWRTVAFLDLPFKHHRPEGVRDGPTAARWAAQGEAARYMGYRFSYLVVRACYRGLGSPSAFAMIVGYLRAVVRGDPVYADDAVRAHVRQQQTLRQLPERVREARRTRRRLEIRT